ncbi:MAG TPA: endo-1,4-beta-xylanase [Candidatus Acidoferrales bacterium]|nr:endo-1,4-beta-xylanase [Candidatus Acidoferrales bacterium]
MLVRLRLSAVRVPACMMGLALVLTALVFLPARSYAQLAAGQNKFLGNIISTSAPSNFSTYWNQVTPENAGKWGSVAASQDTSLWNWASLKLIYNYAVKNGFPFKDHNLVWGQQQPSWMSGLDSLHQVQMVETWIRLCGTNVPKAAFVDVVNEPIHTPPNGQNGNANYIQALGGAGATGWDWVIWAFEKARQYFPNAKLLINEYNILNSAANTTTYINIINLLKARNVIDGIGCQGHSLESTDTNTIKGNLNALAATGLPIYISEYDVNEADDNTQLAIYEQQFPIFWKSPSVKGITLWGYIEGQIWRTNAYLIRSDSSERPAITWLRQYIATNPTGVENPASPIPSKYFLSQNYPNPFNPVTSIEYQLPIETYVTLEVYDILGREIATLVHGRQNAGTHDVTFDAGDLPSGVYFYRIEAGRFAEVKKLVVVR